MVSPLFLLLLWVHDAKPALEGFVLQGKEAQIKQYPHSVYMNILCARVTYICGGSILNQRVILTAAHCLEDCTNKKKDEVFLKYGHENPIFMQSTQVRNFRLHEKYDGDSLDNDIALVTGRKSLPLGRGILRVILASSTPKNSVAYMAGWGVMNSKNEVAVTLLDTMQQMQTRKVCKMLGKLPKGTFCAGSVKGPGVPDRGDSGSALMMNKYIQIGLVSYKVDHYSLVVYTNVSYHYSWIQKTAKILYCG